MGWFKKLLGLKEAEPVVVSEHEQRVEEMQQPKGNLIGQCALCQLAIGEDDVYRNLPKPDGAIAHKKCIKKAQRAAFSGQNPQTVFADKGGN